jgi:hypothetical protein
VRNGAGIADVKSLHEIGPDNLYYRVLKEEL